MKNNKFLITILFLYFFVASLCSQTLTVVKEFASIPNSSVLALYKNQFGHKEKPDLDVTFPYSLVRIRITGNEHEVTMAKKRLGLYLGQLRAVEEVYRDVENELLFLIPSAAGHVDLTCGDGCEKLTILDEVRLQANTIYYGVVHYIPADINEDLEQLKRELLAELENTKDSKHVVRKIERGVYNGHEYADMGLSVKWATCNIGASKSELFGNYIAWGEVYAQTHHSIKSYKWSKGNSIKKLSQIKYNKEDNKQVLDAADDAAAVIWGGAWRMPSKEEYMELRDKCIWTWTTQNGVDGYEVVSKVNGNSIFFPAAGFHVLNMYSGAGTYGMYWTNTLEINEPIYACDMQFNSNAIYVDKLHRHLGLPIRPVCQSVEAQEEAGSLIVRGLPLGAQVLVDDTEIGISPLHLEVLDIGEHHIRIEKEGYVPQEVTVTILKDQEYVLKYTLEDKSLKNSEPNGILPHTYVDLGLSVKWATCNVGANNPEDFGDYYAWGETNVKNSYTESNYSYKDNPSTLPLTSDVANVRWGDNWRMPTLHELYELCEKCTCQWTTQNGITGYKLISKVNGNSIFLPAVGYYCGSLVEDTGIFGCYWTSSLRTDNTSDAYEFNLYVDQGVNVDNNVRYCGQAVRPVFP